MLGEGSVVLGVDWAGDRAGEGCGEESVEVSPPMAISHEWRVRSERSSSHSSWHSAWEPSRRILCSVVRMSTKSSSGKARIAPSSAWASSPSAAATPSMRRAMSLSTRRRSLTSEGDGENVMASTLSTPMRLRQCAFSMVLTTSKPSLLSIELGYSIALWLSAAYADRLAQILGGI